MKKNHILKAIFAFMFLVSISSCEDRELIKAESTSGPILMDLSTSNLVLDENFPANPALTVTWESAQYTVPLETKYTLEISSTESFAVPFVLGTATQSQTRVSFSNKEMNENAKKIGLAPNEFQKMFFRLKSYVSTGQTLSQVSNVTSLNIKPYASSPTYGYQDLFLIGASTAGGWDNNANNSNLLPFLKSSSPDQYSFTGFFKKDITDAGFKIIKVKGSWDAQFGFGSEGKLSTDGGSGNLQVPADGYYKLSIDIAALTYTLVPATAPATTYTNMSIIGTVNGNFDTDTQMTQSTFDPHLWKLLGVSLTAGEFKFRANNNWDNNWGSNSEYFGTGSNGGANIPLSAEWIYDIYFNDATGNYTIIPVL